MSFDKLAETSLPTAGAALFDFVPKAVAVVAAVSSATLGIGWWYINQYCLYIDATWAVGFMQTTGIPSYVALIIIGASLGAFMAAVMVSALGHVPKVVRGVLMGGTFIAFIFSRLAVDGVLSVNLSRPVILLGGFVFAMYMGVGIVRVVDNLPRLKIKWLAYNAELIFAIAWGLVSLTMDAAYATARRDMNKDFSSLSRLTAEALNESDDWRVLAANDSKLLAVRFVENSRARRFKIIDLTSVREIRPNSIPIE